MCIYFIFILFYFILKLYIIILVLPNIKMNPSQEYMCSFCSFKIIWNTKSRLMFHGIWDFWYMNVTYPARVRLENWKTLRSLFSALTTTPSTSLYSLPSAVSPHHSLSSEAQGSQEFWFIHHSHVLFLKALWMCGCFWANILVVFEIPHPFPLNTYFGTLAAGLGSFPFDYPTYLVQSDSHESSSWHSEFDNLW